MNRCCGGLSSTFFVTPQKLLIHTRSRRRSSSVGLSTPERIAAMRTSGSETPVAASRLWTFLECLFRSSPPNRGATVSVSLWSRRFLSGMAVTFRWRGAIARGPFFTVGCRC